MVDSHNLEEMLKFYYGLASKITGTMVGVGTAIATGDKYMGAAIGTVVSHGLDAVGQDIIKRNISPRQEVRVGRAFCVARIKLADAIAEGQKLRSDGFFNRSADGPSTGEEVTEAILLAAMNAAEEKKIDYIGSLLAYIATNEFIDSGTAHQILEISQSMTLRSMMLLKIAHEKSAFEFQHRPRDDGPELDSTMHPIMIELFNLAQRGIVEMKDRSDDDDNYMLTNFQEIDPSKIYPTFIGQLLYDGLSLRDMDSLDPAFLDTRNMLSKASFAASNRSISASDVTAMAAEDLNKNSIVNIFDEGGGSAKVRRADFRKGYLASGFVRQAYNQGSTVTVFTSGDIRHNGELRPGHNYFLGADGSIVEMSAEEPATYVQHLGQASTSSILNFVIGVPIKRA